MDKIRISVIIPLYNSEKYIRRCIESITSQSLKEIEIIVVNDGSIDNSLKIIEELKAKDQRIIVINQENKGVSSARNSGINRASGEYIVQIDSDDWVEEGYLEETYIKAKKENLDIVVTDIIYDNVESIMNYKIDLPIGSDEVISSSRYFDYYFKMEGHHCVWNKLFKSELYSQNNISYPTHISLGEDLATVPILFKSASRIGKINKAYVHYVQNDLSISNFEGSKRIYELLEAFTILDNYFCNENYFLPRKAVEISHWLLYRKYNIEDSYYEKALIYYLTIIKKSKLRELTSIKLRLVFIILKIYPSLYLLRKIYKIKQSNFLNKRKNSIVNNF